MYALVKDGKFELDAVSEHVAPVLLKLATLLLHHAAADLLMQIHHNHQIHSLIYSFITSSVNTVLLITSSPSLR